MARQKSFTQRKVQLESLFIFLHAEPPLHLNISVGPDHNQRGVILGENVVVSSVSTFSVVKS